MNSPNVSFSVNSTSWTSLDLQIHNLKRLYDNVFHCFMKKIAMLSLVWQWGYKMFLWHWSFFFFSRLSVFAFLLKQESSGASEGGNKDLCKVEKPATVRLVGVNWMYSDVMDRIAPLSPGTFIVTLQNIFLSALSVPTSSHSLQIKMAPAFVRRHWRGIREHIYYSQSLPHWNRVSPPYCPMGLTWALFFCSVKSHWWGTLHCPALKLASSEILWLHLFSRARSSQII